MLQALRISCRRGSQLIWDDLSFTIDAGQILQINGANGSGKTSLLRILAGLAQPDQGKVYWQEQAQLCFVGHQPAIKNELTVRENLQYQFGIHRAEHHKLLAKIELTSYEDHFGYQLSHGQKQRVALTRLLFNPAQVWILDEPMSGLDSATNIKLQNIFAEHLQNGGMIALSSHQPLTQPEVCSRSVHLSL